VRAHLDPRPLHPERRLQESRRGHVDLNVEIMIGVSELDGESNQAVLERFVTHLDLKDIDLADRFPAGRQLGDEISAVVE
jgi:hypothetical protein